MNQHDLSGRIAIVTGASRAVGIGAACARQLAAAGAAVFLTWYQAYDAEMPWGSRPAEVESLLADLRRQGAAVAGMEFDLSRPQAAAVLFDQVERDLGSPDILVNNATYSVDVDIDHLDAGILDRHYAVNLRGMALLCAEFARRFHKTQDGRIINLTSGQGVGPMPGNLAYAATKGAVDAFTASLSAELAPRGITVNAVDPGPTDTGWMSPELKARLAASAPMGRIGLPADAARLVCFLASPEAAWITGQVLRSRGGF
jgi:3-oxoacyl-[acyl-carrier protein] reductase